MATNTITFKGKNYSVTDNRIKKLSEIMIDVPHIVVDKDPNPTRHGSFVVEVRNEDTEEILQCYMPKYIAKNCTIGKVFFYKGLHAKDDNSGHTYHKVMWGQEKCV